MNSGQPFTVNSIFDVNLDGNLTDRLNTTSGLVRTGNRQQPLLLTVAPATLLAPVGSNGAVTRNTFRAGGLVELDLAASKRRSNLRRTGQGLHRLGCTKEGLVREKASIAEHPGKLSV